MLLKWIGGKHHLAEFIISKMPSHKFYYEVFFGAGHVFWQKSLAQFNVINDINGKLVNLYKVIRDADKKEELKELLQHEIYAREIFDAYKVLYDHDAKWLDIRDRVQQAFIYLMLNRMSFNGQFQTFASRDDASPILNLEKTIEIMHRKMRDGQVVIEHESFDDFIKDKDKQDAFLYLDPPYMVTTETKGMEYYEKVMKLDQHYDLAFLLKKMKMSKWLLSYDDHPKVHELYPEEEGKIWVTKTPSTAQTAANATVGRSGIDTVYKQELLIANYDLNNVGGLFEQSGL